MEQRDHVQHVLEQWRRENPRLDRSSFAVIGRISRLAQLLEEEHEPIFAANGVNGGEFDVLAALRRAGRPYRLTPTALSKALMVTSGGMTKRLAGLERRGLVRREPDPEDGRSTAVSLTREGVRLVDAVLADHVANQQRLLVGLDRRELDRARPTPRKARVVPRRPSRTAPHAETCPNVAPVSPLARGRRARCRLPQGSLELRRPAASPIANSWSCGSIDLNSSDAGDNGVR